MKFKVVYAYESLANFPNHEHLELFNTVEDAFAWVKENRIPENVYVVEAVEEGEPK